MKRRTVGLIAGLVIVVVMGRGGPKIGAQDGTGTPHNLMPITLENVGQLEEVDGWEGDGTAVSSVEFSRRDPNLIAYGTMAGYTYLGQLDDHTNTILEHGTGEIVDVAFSLGSDYLASARPLLDALLWTTDPPAWYALYQTPVSVLAVTFSPDGFTLVFGGEGRARVSDAATTQGGGLITLIQLDKNMDLPDALHRIYEDSGQINSLAYSPDGIHLAVGIGGGDSIEPGGLIKVWNLETMLTARTLRGHTGAVLDVKYDPTGQFLASASADYTIRLWDLTTGKLVMTFLWHTDEVNAVAFSPDGSLLASAGKDGTVRFWEVATGEQVGLIDLNGDAPYPVWDVDFSADGKMVATASESGVVQLWGVWGEEGVWGSGLK